MTLAQSQHAVDTTDPYLWLEDVTGEKPLAWVKEQDAKSKAELEARPEFKAHPRAPARDLQLARAHSRRGEARPVALQLLAGRGRTRAASGGARRSPSTARPSPRGKTVLDIDKLERRRERRTGSGRARRACIPTTSAASCRSRVAARTPSRSASSTSVKKAFVKGGFLLPESKGDVAWRNRDTLYIATRLRPRHAHQVGLSAHREGMEARHAARRGEGDLRGQGDRRRPRAARRCTRRAASTTCCAAPSRSGRARTTCAWATSG